MRLAHEFRRPDWRRMLGEMSASEFMSWVAYFSRQPFSQQLLDAEFATTKALMMMAFAGNSDVTAEDFSLLAGADEAPEEPDKTDEELMALGEGLFGGVRYVPDSQ